MNDFEKAIWETANGAMTVITVLFTIWAVAVISTFFLIQEVASWSN